MTTAHPEHPDPVLSTRDLPRGSTAVDRSGHTLITWPDGQYGYVGERKFPAVLPGVSPSSSTGPYTVTRTGLTAPDCDLIHAGIPVDEVEDLGPYLPDADDQGPINASDDPEHVVEDEPSTPEELERARDVVRECRLQQDALPSVRVVRYAEGHVPSEPIMTMETAREHVRGWLRAAGGAGDMATVRAFELLGEEEAARVYLDVDGHRFPVQGPAVNCTLTRLEDAPVAGAVVVEGATVDDAMAGAAAYFRARNERRKVLEEPFNGAGSRIVEVLESTADEDDLDDDAPEIGRPISLAELRQIQAGIPFADPADRPVRPAPYGGHVPGCKFRGALERGEPVDLPTTPECDCAAILNRVDLEDVELRARLADAFRGRQELAEEAADLPAPAQPRIPLGHAGTLDVEAMLGQAVAEAPARDVVNEVAEQYREAQRFNGEPGTPLPPDELADKLDAALEHQRELNREDAAAMKERIRGTLFTESAEFGPEDVAKLERLAAGMLKFPGLRVDLPASAEPRASAIKAFLVGRGVEADRIQIVDPVEDRSENLERMVDAMLQRQAFLAGLEQRTDVEDAELRRLVSWFKIGAVEGAPVRKAEIVDLVRTVDRLGVERRELLFRLAVKRLADLPPLDEASREELERFVPADHVGGGDRGQLPFEVRTFGRCLSIRVGFDTLARMAEEAPNVPDIRVTDPDAFAEVVLDALGEEDERSHAHGIGTSIALWAFHEAIELAVEEATDGSGFGAKCLELVDEEPEEGAPDEPSAEEVVGTLAEVEARLRAAGEFVGTGSEMGGADEDEGI